MLTKVYKATKRVTLFRDMDGKTKLARNSDNFVCTLDLSEATDMMDMSDYQFEHCAQTYIQGVEIERRKYGYPFTSVDG